MDPIGTDEALSLEEAQALLEQTRADNEDDLTSARAKLDEMAGDGSSSSDNMTDVVTAAQFMLDDATSILAEITAAEARLAEGTYGQCDNCGRQIAPGRLRARPYVRRCVACAA